MRLSGRLPGTFAEQTYKHRARDALGLADLRLAAPKLERAKADEGGNTGLPGAATKNTGDDACLHAGRADDRRGDSL